MADTEAPASASETLSQLLARILDQLALSAWLPAGALTLLVWFVMRLGSVLDASHPPGTAGEALSDTFASIGRTSIGGLLLLLAAVIVLTMLTQAFSFEAIRVMEGYWGTNRGLQWLAKLFCNHHRRVRGKLDKRLTQLTEAAWRTADDEIADMQEKLVSRGLPMVLTPNVITALRARALGKRPTVTLDVDEKARFDRTDWKKYADPELLRRRVSLQKRLRDYPRPSNVLPTRLGNVLRHHEDATGRVEVEGMVNDVYDSLPFTLRLSHDEHRSRLDVYCSMVFVLVLVGVVAAGRFAESHWRYAVASGVIAVVAALFCYRAAVASARAYGAVLLVIARRVQTSPPPTPTPPSGGTS